MAIILITGCSKGIGFESALAFARAGHLVQATMRSPESSPSLAQIAASEGLPIAVSRIDVDSDDSVREGIAALLAVGQIDVLVNNAGVESLGSIEEQPLSQFAPSWRQTTSASSAAYRRFCRRCDSGKADAS